ncbi:MAG: potassium channel family protein [Acetobacterium sp.]
MNIIIVGGGQVGSYLASLLLKEGHRVKVIEQREKQVTALQHELPANAVISGNFTDTRVLESAGINQADLVIAVMPTDEGNLVIATLAHFEYKVKQVIARINYPKNSWLFTPEMGVDVALSEADLMGRAVTEQILMS